jgi:hypothetical protein
MPTVLSSRKPAWWPHFSSTLRSTAVTARLGLVLGIAVLTCFLTGLLSYFQYQAWEWLPPPGESSVGLPRHAGCARGHRRGRNPIGARQAVERLPEPLPLAAVSFGEAGHRADHSGAFGLGNVGAAIHRILQCPQLVPLPVGFRVGPLPLGLRGGRFGAAPRRGEVARHRLRAADEDRRGRCAHRGAMERKS